MSKKFVLISCHNEYAVQNGRQTELMPSGLTIEAADTCDELAKLIADKIIKLPDKLMAAYMIFSDFEALVTLAARWRIPVGRSINGISVHCCDDVLINVSLADLIQKDIQANVSERLIEYRFEKKVSEAREAAAAEIEVEKARYQQYLTLKAIYEPKKEDQDAAVFEPPEGNSTERYQEKTEGILI